MAVLYLLILVHFLRAVATTDVFIGFIPALDPYGYTAFASGQLKDGLQLAFEEFNSLPPAIFPCQNYNFSLNPPSSPNTIVATISLSGFSTQTNGSTPSVVFFDEDGVQLGSSITLRISRQEEMFAGFLHLRVKLGIQIVAVLHEIGFVDAISLEQLTAYANVTGLKLLAVIPASVRSDFKDVFATGLQAAPFRPDAILVVGKSSFAAAAILNAKIQPLLHEVAFMVISAVDPTEFAQDLNWSTSNIFMTQPLPFFGDSTMIVLDRFRSSVEKQPLIPANAWSFEGYLMGRLIASWFGRIRSKECGVSITPSWFVEVVYGCCCSVRIDDLEVGPFLNGTKTQGLHQAWILQGNGTTFVTVGTTDLTINRPTPKAFVFGQSAPLTGPSAINGHQLRAGLQAAFEEQNRKGGVWGRKLSLISLDDGYNVTRAQANAKAFLNFGVHGLIGFYGTAVSNAVSAMAAEAGIPYFAPFTGSLTLRDTSVNSRYTVNIRASYADEVNAFTAELEFV